MPLGHPEPRKCRLMPLYCLRYAPCSPHFAIFWRITRWPDHSSGALWFRSLHYQSTHPILRHSWWSPMATKHVLPLVQVILLPQAESQCLTSMTASKSIGISLSSSKMTTARSTREFLLSSPLIVLEKGISEYINGFVFLVFELSINFLKWKQAVECKLDSLRILLRSYSSLTIFS